MSIHSQFKTNSAKEVEGVEIKFAPNDDKTVPAFIISRASKSNTAYAKALEKATRPYRRVIELGSMKAEDAEEIFRQVFVETILKGWKNVQDEKGNEIVFNEENALKLMLELPDLYEELQEKSKSASSFRDELSDKEAKN